MKLSHPWKSKELAGIAVGVSNPRWVCYYILLQGYTSFYLTFCRGSIRSWWMLRSLTGLGLVIIPGRLSQDILSDSSSTGSSLTGGPSGPGARSVRPQTLSLPRPTSSETSNTMDTSFIILTGTGAYRGLAALNKCWFYICKAPALLLWAFIRAHSLITSLLGRLNDCTHWLVTFNKTLLLF